MRVKVKGRRKKKKKWEEEMVGSDVENEGEEDDIYKVFNKLNLPL